jgi:hypothetical protein
MLSGWVYPDISFAQARAWRGRRNALIFGGKVE